jgi:flagellar hook protein FlgE
MSLFGSMDTAISGLNAQSAAFSNISDNMANSQTIGFKEVDTSFQDVLTSSSALQNLSGSVDSRPQYQNEIEGTVQQSSDPLALAISGQGFFAVSEQSGTTSAGEPEFANQQYYTRAGDFTQDAKGYLVNSAGEYLNAWPVESDGTVNSSELVPIQVAPFTFSPIATSTITLVGNVPSSPTTNSALSAETTVYDSAGTAHSLVTTWAQATSSGTVVPNQWVVSFSSPDNTTGASYTNGATNTADDATFIGSADVTFNSDGTLESVVADTNNPGGLTASTVTTDGGSVTNAIATISADFGGGSQNIAIDLGSIGEADGITQYAGTNYTVDSADQNGAGPGVFSSVSITDSGQVQVNYDNGKTQTIAQIPLVTFQDADALQRQNGQAFTQTTASGGPSVDALNTNGAGGLVVGSIESSNVDLATQLSALIVAQQTYGANAKVVTTADDMITTALEMKQS